jgi:hypothetical protein
MTMKRLIITLILALGVAAPANAQVLELTTWPAIPAAQGVNDAAPQSPSSEDADVEAVGDRAQTSEGTHAADQADVATQEAQSVAVVASEALNTGRPGTNPPPATDRPTVPCGFAHACPDGSSVPVVPRPTVPKLISVTGALVVGDRLPVQAPLYECFFNFQVDAIGAGPLTPVTLSRRDLGSSGLFVKTYVVDAVNGHATLTVPIRDASGEWRASYFGDTSNTFTVSDAFWIGCG